MALDLEARKKGIGGSDAGAILGISPWKTPLQVYMDKVGATDPIQDNDSMFWGRTLEPVIRQRYADVTNRKVVVPDTLITHPKFEFMIGNLDGITSDNRVLEIKTARSAEGWGEPGSNEIPDSYMIQVQHYMLITAIPVADVAVLIGGSDFRIYEVPAEPELMELMIEKETGFWSRVINRDPPEPITYQDMLLKYGRTSKESRVQADVVAMAAVARLKEIKAIVKEEDKLKTVIMAAFGESDTLMDNNKVLATWKAGNGSKRFNAKLFEAENPELYKKYIVRSEPTRRLLLK